MMLHQDIGQSWKTFSLEVQLGNVGSELSRARRFYTLGNKEQFIHSLDRTQELLYLTIGDERWKAKRGELTRLKEVLNDWYEGGETYYVSLDTLVTYLTQFGLMARKNV